MDTGTGVSTSRLQGEMRTPIASSAMEAVAHCSRSNSLNNDVNGTFCKGFRAQQMEGIRVTDSYPQDLGEVRVCSYPSVAGGGAAGVGIDVYSRCNKAAGGSSGKRVFMFPHTAATQKQYPLRKPPH